MSSATTSVTATTTSLSTGVQYGFYFDQGRCFSCRTCSIVCRDWHNIPAGPVKLLRVFRWEKGTFPNPDLQVLATMCYHCANPVCIPAANGAMMKEPKYGAVLIDPAQANSPSLRDAFDACPYGAISFDSDSSTANAYKCNMCIDRLEQGLMPVCVMSCPSRALDFGPIADLQSKYGTTLAQLEDMPDPSITHPSAVFKPAPQKIQLVPYDVPTALSLLAARGSLPPVMQDTSNVTNTSGVATNTLIMKAANVAQAMATTKDDMG